jgi:hypothetical protein
MNTEYRKSHKKTVAILKQKCHFFSFIKSENRRAEQVLSCLEGLVPVGGGRRWGKGMGG